MFTNRSLSLGGSTGVSVANTDIVPALKTAEGLGVNTPFVIYKIGIFVDINCNISVNNGTAIPLIANQIFNSDSIMITSLKFLNSGINFKITYGY